MAILTEDMKRVVREQRLGFYATVGENIRDGSLVEVNVVDPFDGTTTETDMVRMFQARFARLHERLESPSTRVVRDD